MRSASRRTAAFVLEAGVLPTSLRRSSRALFRKLPSPVLVSPIGPVVNGEFRERARNMPPRHAMNGVQNRVFAASVSLSEVLQAVAASRVFSADSSDRASGEFRRAARVTARSSLLGYFIVGVVLDGSQKQMFGPHARRVVAAMKHVLAGRYRAMNHFPRCAVGCNHARLPVSKLSIAAAPDGIGP